MANLLRMIAVFALTLCGLPAVVWGQAGNGNAAPVRPANASPTASQDLLNPLIQSIRERASQGAEGLGDAMNKSVRIARWDILGELLQQLVNRNVPRADLAKVARQMSDPTLFQMRLSARLTEEQRTVVQRLQVAAFEEARDPQKLDSFISKLATQNATERREAENELLRGDEIAIARLVRALINGATTDQAASVRPVVNMLAKFRPASVGAVERAALDSMLKSDATPAVQQTLGSALWSLDPSTGTRHWLMVLNAQSSSEGLKTFARQFLEQTQSQITTLEQVRASLHRELTYALEGWSRAGSSGGTMKPVWLSGNDDQPVVSAQLSERDALSANAAMIAQRFRLVGTPDIASDDLVLATELGAAYSEDSAYGLAEDALQQLGNRLGIPVEQLGPVLERVLSLSTKHDLVEAGVVAIRLMSQTKELSLLSQAGGEPTQLVKALDSGNAAVRYEAVAAISQLRTEVVEHFIGESIYEKRLRQLARVTDMPLAMIIEPRNATAALQEQWLRQLGYEVLRAKTGQEAIVLLNDLPGIELALLSAHPADVGPIELTDRIRKLPQAASAGVLIVGAPPEEKGLGVQNPPLVIGPAKWVPSIESSADFIRFHKDLFGGSRSLAFDARAFIIEQREAVAKTWQQWLEAAGYEVIWSPRLIDSIYAVENSSRADLVMMSSSDSDFDPVALTERVRKSPQIAGVPFLVVGPEPMEPRREVAITETWTAPTIWVTLLDSPLVLADLRDRLQAESHDVPLEPLDRTRLRNQAVSVLGDKTP